MSELTAFRLTQGVYWLFLGMWIGGMVMLVIGAAITFKTVREYRPALGLEPYNHPALAESAPGILAGGITGNVIRGLRTLQIVCAVVVAIALVLQCTAFADYLSGGWKGTANLLRIALVALPVLVLLVENKVIAPRVWEQRLVMYNPQTPPEKREEARAIFMRYHKLNERLVSLAALSLIAAILASPFAFKTYSTPLPSSVGAAPGKDLTRG